MHIIIGLITAIAGLIWALHSLQRSGVNLNSFNPFFWLRRRRWAEQTVNPLYAIDSTRELAAVLAFATLRLGGDPTAEQKAELVRQFREQLRYGDKEASELYGVASHLVSTDANYGEHVEVIMAPALADFTDEQAEATVALLRHMAGFGDAPSDQQQRFVDEIQERLDRRPRQGR